MILFAQCGLTELHIAYRLPKKLIAFPSNEERLFHFESKIMLKEQKRNVSNNINTLYPITWFVLILLFRLTSIS